MPLATLAALLLAAAPAPPPPTETRPVVDTMHGVEITDDYRWLEALEAESPEVAAWTTAQNDYTRGILDALPGRENLESQLGELMSIGSVTAPVMRGNRYFYTERRGDQNQPVLFLRDGHDGTPRELLDVNTLDDRGLYALDWFVPSPSGDLVAFGLSYAGDEMTVLHVMDTDTARWHADEIPGKIDWGGWAPTERSFLYGQLTDPDDAYSRVFRWHELGTHWRDDPILVRQTDPSIIPGATLSENGRWIVIQKFQGWAKQDVYAADVAAWKRTGAFEPVPVAVGLDARFEPTIVHGDTLYLFTTHDAPNGMLYAVDLLAPAKDDWTVVVPEDPQRVMIEVDAARGMLVVKYQQDVTTRFERFTLDGRSLGDVELPGLGTAGLSTNRDRTEAFLTYTSYNEPTSIYRIDLEDGAAGELWARPEVPVDPSTVVVRQEWCTSKDGTRVPMFIVHKKGLQKNGRLPTLVYGYGGFDVSITPRFIATNFPWYDNGGVYVVATLRGGGEYGEAWHKAGMLDKKQNVYDDLYAVAEHLIAQGYSTPDHMAVLGGSNGGLLTGVAATQRPDLWAAAISAVPLLDMLRFPDFLMAKFWVPEYGDPQKPEDFAWLRAYSPYHNIEPGKTYPAMLITAGENDNRVHPMHARKMVAALQTHAGNDPAENPVMLWVDRDGGHGQGKPLNLRIRDIADRWSFVMWKTGMLSGLAPAEPTAAGTKN